MTYRPAARTAPPVLASARYPDAVAVFAAHAGWSAHDWDRLYGFTQQPRLDQGATTAAANLAGWLRNPPDTFDVPISPTQVRDMFARHGRQAGQLLTAIAAGASERFAVAFLGPHWVREDYSAAVFGWRRAALLGLDEPAATGWAVTGYLRWHSPELLTAIELMVADWVAQFGPVAYLWVLAGYTLPEAVTIRTSGDQVTDQQLRVAAALNGHPLPPGI